MRRFLFLALGLGMLLPTAAKAHDADDFANYKSRCVLATHWLLVKDKQVASASQIDKSCHCVAKESVIKQKMTSPNWCPGYNTVKIKLMNKTFTGEWD